MRPGLGLLIIIMMVHASPLTALVGVAQSNSSNIYYTLAPNDVIEVHGWVVAGVNNTCAYGGGFWIHMSTSKYSINWLPGVIAGYGYNTYGKLYMWDYAGQIGPYHLTPAAGKGPLNEAPRKETNPPRKLEYNLRLEITDEMVPPAELQRLAKAGDTWAQKARFYYAQVYYVAYLDYSIDTMTRGTITGRHKIYLPDDGGEWKVAVAHVRIPLRSCSSFWYDVEINKREAVVRPVTVHAPNTITIEQGMIDKARIRITSPYPLHGSLKVMISTDKNAVEIRSTPTKPWGPQGPSVYIAPGSDLDVSDGQATIDLVIDAREARPGMYSGDIELYLAGHKLLAADNIGNVTGDIKLASVSLGETGSTQSMVAIAIAATIIIALAALAARR